MRFFPEPMERIVMISLSVILTLILFCQPVFADTLDDRCL